MSELLPMACPFCGEHVKIVERDKLFVFRCPDTSPCIGSGMATYGKLDQRETAIAAWNTRTQAPEAIRAAALEEAAKVAETRFKNSAPAYGEVIAAAIRALDPTMAGFSIHPFTGSTE